MRDGSTGECEGAGGSASADVVVVGGGIVGRACAFLLQAGGRRVVLVDPDGSDPDRVPYGSEWVGPASHGNAGHIATEQVRPLTEPGFLLSAPRRLFAFGGPLDLGWRRPSAWLPWALRATRACFRAEAGTRALEFLLADAMPAWYRLAAALGAPELVRDAGHLMLWHDPARFEREAPNWHCGPTGTATVSALSAAEMDTVRVCLSRPPAAGLRFDRTGQVSDPVRVMRLLRQRFVERGGQVIEQRAVALPEPGGRVRLADGSEVAGRCILLAAGVGSARLCAAGGTRLPLVAERGYHLEWEHGTADLGPDWTLPPLVFSERAVIVSRFGTRLRASSFVEFDREDAPPDPRKWQRLEQHVRAIGLPVASPFRRWMGARPTLPDYLPAIGAHPDRPDLLVATGHGHLGLTLAPRTAELVRQLLDGIVLPGLRPFAPGRFSRARPAPRHSAARHPARTEP